MNALELILDPDGGVTLPIAYRQLIQGALYHIWEEPIPELHDEGYSTGGRTFRMFTFSGLEPLKNRGGSYRQAGGVISFFGPLRMEVRSPVPALLDPLVESFARDQTLLLGNQRLRISEMYCRDCVLFPPRALIELETPLTLHRTTPDGSTRYYSPDEEDFYLLLAENLTSKLEAAHLSLDPCISLTPVEGTLKRRIARFRNTYITGWTGRFLLETEPETMAFLYCTGLGARNSQGFGMFKLVTM